MLLKSWQKYFRDFQEKEGSLLRKITKKEGFSENVQLRN